MRNHAVASVPVRIKIILPGTLSFERRVRNLFNLFSNVSLDIIVVIDFKATKLYKICNHHQQTEIKGIINQLFLMTLN